VWARLTSGIDASAFLQQAIAQNVIFVPGTAFYADNVDQAAFRLSYAAPCIGDIHEGVTRLKNALHAA
jgi:2-aminoadipate transaminase